MRRLFNPTRTAALSLVELLVVISLIAVLAALVVPAFNMIAGAGGLTKTANDFAGILEHARAHAMANNTYVWVGIQEEATDEVVVGVVASNTGASDPSSDVVPLGKLTRFRNVKVVEAPSSGARPVVPKVGQLAGTSDPALAFTFGTGDSKVDFEKQVIQWNSRGEARMKAAQLSRIIEVGFQASANGTVVQPANYAALQIHGLSGAVSIFRP